MKSINEYIDDTIEYKIFNEASSNPNGGGLLNWFKAFFEKIFKNQNELIDEETGKVKMQTIEEKNLKVQKEPMPYDKVSRNTLKLWQNTKTGFKIAGLISKNPKNFFKKGDEIMNPMVYCYFSKEGKRNTYSSGILMVEEEKYFVEGYRHIIDLESNLVVDNPTEVNEMILDQYVENCKDNSPDTKGFTAKTTVHAVLTSNLKKLGFKISDSDKELLIYNIV